MIWWIILFGGSLLTLALIRGLLSSAENKPWLYQLYVIASAVIVVVVAYIQYTVVWPRANASSQAADSAAKEEFVKEKMQDKLGRPPDELKLWKESQTGKRYVGTARYGEDVWDVVVWTERLHRAEVDHMKATPRTPAREDPTVAKTKAMMERQSEEYINRILAAHDLQVPNPDRDSAIVRGNGYRFSKEYDKAIKEYDKAIRLDPKSPNAFFNRGLTYADMKAYDKAIKDYDQTLRLNPGDSFVLQLRQAAVAAQLAKERE